MVKKGALSAPRRACRSNHAGINALAQRAAPENLLLRSLFMPEKSERIPRLTFIKKKKKKLQSL